MQGNEDDIYRFDGSPSFQFWVVGFQDLVLVDHSPKCDFVNVSQVHCVMKP